MNNTINGKHVTGTAYNDTIYNSGNKVTIDSGRYDDVIANSGSKVTIYGGTENDSITNSGETVKIFAGDGNDSIINRSSEVTINAGDGQDTIINYSPNVTISGDNGNDYIRVGDIYGNGRRNTLDNFAFVDGGGGNDTIYNIFYYSTIKGGAGDDYIYNSASNITINGGTGDDSITSSGDNISITGGDGNDSIRNYQGQDATIDGGSGDDTLDCVIQWKYTWQGSSSVSGHYENYYSINGGTGNDLINLSGYQTFSNGDKPMIGGTSINGGVGDDTIQGNSNGNNIYQYSNGDGNDHIYNFGSSDTLLIAAENYTTVPLGNDIIVNVGKGSIHLYDVADKNVTVKKDNSRMVYGTNGADSINNSVSGATISALAGNDTINNWGTSVKVDGGKGNDTIKNYGDNVTIIGGAGNDYITTDYSHIGNVYQYAKGDGNDTIIGFNESDTLQITGGVYSKTLSGNDTVIKVGSNSITLKDTKNKNLNIKGTLDTVTANTLPAGLSYNTGKTILTASTKFTGNAIDLADYDPTVTKVNAASLTKGISIIGSSAANSLKGGKGADTISGGTGNDTLTGGNGKDIFVYSSGKDVITDYVAGQDKIKLTGDTIKSASISGSDVILSVGTGSIKVKNGKSKKITVIDANGKETTKVYPEKIINGTTKADNLNNTLSGYTINGLAGNDTITNSASAVTISGGAGNDFVKNKGSNIYVNVNDGADKISIGGSAKGVTVVGGTGNDTIYSNGNGNIFQYATGDGKDVISGYSASDTIKISSGAISKSSVSGSNVVFTVGTGTITVKNGKGKAITVVDASGKKTTTTYPTLPSGLSLDSKGTKLTVGTKYTSTAVDLSKYVSTIKTVDASALTKKIKISGGSNAMSIVGGKGNDTLIGGSKADTIKGGTGNDSLNGGAGNDTLYGGAGNDTLTGGKGNDRFVYEGGKDVITDYTAGEDQIKISGGKISKTSYSGKDVIFTIGSGTLKVKNGNGKKITIIDANNKSTTKPYSSSSSDISNLLYDDTNFVTGEVKIDDITEVTENNYTVGKVDLSSSLTEIEQPDNYELTYGKDTK